MPSASETILILLGIGGIAAGGYFLYRQMQGSRIEVFHIKSDKGYAKYSDYAKIVRKYKLANEAQLKKAMNDGASWCSTGFLVGTTDRKFPSQITRPGCGTEMSVNTYNPVSEDADKVALGGINVIGVKPSEDEAAELFPGFTILPWQDAPEVIWSKYDQ